MATAVLAPDATPEEAIALARTVYRREFVADRAVGRGTWRIVLDLVRAVAGEARSYARRGPLDWLAYRIDYDDDWRRRLARRDYNDAGQRPTPILIDARAVFDGIDPAMLRHVGMPALLHDPRATLVAYFDINIDGAHVEGSVVYLLTPGTRFCGRCARINCKGRCEIVRPACSGCFDFVCRPAAACPVARMSAVQRAAHEETKITRYAARGAGMIHRAGWFFDTLKKRLGTHCSCWLRDSGPAVEAAAQAIFESPNEYRREIDARVAAARDAAARAAAGRPPRR